MDNIIITVRLKTDQVNLILQKLGQCPFVEVAELIGLIKEQGDAALNQARLLREAEISQSGQSALAQNGATVPE